jgi:hypothetical protein
MRQSHRHRKEPTCRIMAHHFEFLSVGEQFGADALFLANAAHDTNLRISRAARRAPLMGELLPMPRN